MINGNSELLYTFHVLGVAFYHTWWVILPFSLYWIFKILHTDFVFIRSVNSYFRKLQWTFLEVIPPKEIERGPKMMESVFQGLSGVTTTPNNFDLWIDGKIIQDRFSFEIFGENGKAHFIIRVQKRLRNMVEANIYAQYPGAEIKEVEDYTSRFPRIMPNKQWEMWGTDFRFTTDIPIPIRTYDKFEEDITGEMIDPMATLMEVIGTLTPNQYIWMQYAVEPHLEKWNYDAAHKAVINKLKKKEDPAKMNFLDHLMDVMRNFFKGFTAPPEFAVAAKSQDQPLEFKLSPLEKDLLKATEEKLGKNLFKTKMRFVYIGKRENFDKAFLSSFIGGIKQFNDMNYNQVIPEDVSKTYGKIFFKDITADFRKRKLYKRYKDRDPTGVIVHFSTKEMATVYHFPDMGVMAPSVPRVASKLGTAPPNLPIE